MATLSALDTFTETRDTKDETRTFAEQQHAKDAAIYRRLLYADTAADTPIASTATAAPEREMLPESDATQRFADYRPYAMPAGKKVLFEGITYKDGELIDERATVPAPVSDAGTTAAPAPVAEPVSEEDLMPTSTTMETLRRSAPAAVESTETKSGVNFFSVLSTKAKVAIVAVAVAIVMAIIFICVNTSIINSLNANVAALRAEAMQQQTTYETLSSRVQDIENYEGEWGEKVEEYAKAHGMVKK